MEQKTESQVEGKIEMPVLATNKTPAALEHHYMPNTSASTRVSARTYLYNFMILVT